MQFFLLAKQSTSIDFPEDWKCKDTIPVGRQDFPVEFDIKANEKYCLFSAAGVAFIFGKELKIEAKKINSEGKAGDDIGTEENSFGVSVTDMLGAVIAVSSKTDQTISAVVIAVEYPESYTNVFDTYTGVTRKLKNKSAAKAGEKGCVEYYKNFNPKGVKVTVKSGKFVGYPFTEHEYDNLAAPFMVQITEPGKSEATAELEIAKKERDPRVPEIYMKIGIEQKVFKSSDAGDSYSDSGSGSGSGSGNKMIIGIIIGAIAVVVIAIGGVVYWLKHRRIEDTTGMVQM